MARSERDLILNLKERREGHAFVEAARDLEKLSRGADASGDHFDAMSRDARSLGVEIEKTKNRIHDLNTQFIRTGDRSLFGDIRKERSFLRELQKISGEAGGESGKGFASGFLGAMGSLPSQVRGTAIAGIVGVVAAALPALGAMIAGAVVGTTALGGIAGGIAAAAHNPQVKSAAKEFATSISAEFFSAGDAFVKPTQRALKILQADFNALDLEEAFGKGAGAVEVLARGVGNFAKNIMPGFNRVMDESGKIAAVLGDGFAGLGDALGDMLRDMANNEGTLEGLHLLMVLIESTIRVTAKTVDVLTTAFHYLAESGARITGIFEKVSPLFSIINNVLEGIAGTNEHVVSRFGDLAGASDDVADGFDGVSDKAKVATTSLGGLESAMRDLWNLSKDAAQASDDYEAAIDDLTGSLKDNGTTIDANTEKGRANRQAFRNAIQTARDMRQANIDNGMSVDDANAKYEAQISKIERIGRRAGITEDELRDMAGKYKIDIVVKWFEKNRPQIINSREHGIEIRLPGGGRLQEFAHGGATPRHEPFRVHEGEVMFSDRSHYVATKAQVEAMSRQAVSTGGTVPMDVRPLIVSGGGFADEFFRWLQNEVRRRGGTLAVLGVS